MRKRRQRRARPQSGFTLIELMISLVLFSFAIAGVLSVAVSLTQGFREQRGAVEAEGAVRVPIDFLADALRQASPGVSDPTKVQDAGTCSIGAITVSNDPNGDGLDELDLIYASGAVVTSLQTPYDAGTTSVTVADGSQLAAGDSILITDLSNGHLVKILGVSGNSLTLASQCGGIVLPTGGYPVNSLVIRATHAHFKVAPVDGVPTLMMNPDTSSISNYEPLAEGIEDMQIAVAVDTNNDGTVTEDGTTGDEWMYNAAGDPALTGTVRAIRVTLISRTVQPLVGNTTPFFRPAAEDHAMGANDAYRRRVLRTTVELRNIGGSP